MSLHLVTVMCTRLDAFLLVSCYLGHKERVCLTVPGCWLLGLGVCFGAWQLHHGGGPGCPLAVELVILLLQHAGAVCQHCKSQPLAQGLVQSAARVAPGQGVVGAG